MMRILRYFLVLTLLVSFVGGINADDYKTHKVKKKETLYSIARENGLTVDQLRAANPVMSTPGYQLKKGEIIRVPIMLSGTNGDVRQRPVRLGVALPLNTDTEDGQRMLEYYRGVLMACDSLRHEGISVDVQAWNLPENGDVNVVLSDPLAANRDIIIGPLYEKYVSDLARFANNRGIMLVVPFSIHAAEVYTNPHLFQIYQNHSELNESTSRRFAEWFHAFHPVVIDGGDKASTKGSFTSVLRKHLSDRRVMFNVTSLRTSDRDFAHAFASNMPNIVVLNTASPTVMQAMFTKLTNLMRTYPDVQISVFGYMEWMPYTSQNLAKFHHFNMYLPAPFYTNLDTPLARRLQDKYRWNFHQEMINILPRFALTGFDHAAFFLRGLHMYGAAFDGSADTQSGNPAQTPLKFERLGVGGYQNRGYLFVHYKSDGSIETINY